MRTNVACLGSYKNFDLDRCLNKKLKTFNRDEADLRRPLIISLVIPTKIDVGRKTRKLELETLGKMLSECSILIDQGYLDEILVIDASMDQNGQPDYSTLMKVVQTAYAEINLFKKQVCNLREHRAEAMNAERGVFDFVVRTVHQFDNNIFHVLKKYDINKIANLTRMPYGKGTALWLAVPITKGDILCFLDSDIMNFKREFVVSLCEPILNALKKNRQHYITKACYNRLTLTCESPYGYYTYGGRVTRIFAIPLLKILARKFPKIFYGFDSIKYPLSGEFAVKKEFIENICFPNDYSIEFSILNQTIRKYSLESIAQVDLELLCHIGQSVKSMNIMITEITNRVIKTLEKEKIILSKIEKEDVILEYKKETLKILPTYWNVFKKMQKQNEINRTLKYSRDMDMRRFRQFYNTFKINFLGKPTTEQILLPSWTKINENNNYFAISTMLKRRSNQSTYSRLIKAELV